MVKVLISLRNAAETKNAASLPIDYFDFKEPENGSMGSLNKSDLLEAIKVLGRDKKISMACGELEKATSDSWQWDMDVDFFKVGLAGLESHKETWISKILELRRILQTRKTFPVLVPVFYADHKLANSPPVLNGVKKLLAEGFRLFLVDTWAKSGGGLLDHMTTEMLFDLQNMILNSGAEYGLAGKLNKQDCIRLMKANILPNWFGARGAVCVSGKREAAFDAHLAKEFIYSIQLAQR